MEYRQVYFRWLLCCPTAGEEDVSLGACAADNSGRRIKLLKFASLQPRADGTAIRQLSHDFSQLLSVTESTVADKLAAIPKYTNCCTHLLHSFSKDTAVVTPACSVTK